MLNRKSKTQKPQPQPRGRRKSTQAPPGRAPSPYLYHASRSQREGPQARQAEEVTERERSVTASPQRRRLLLGIAFFLAVFLYFTWLSGVPTISIMNAATEEPLLQNTSVYQLAAKKLLNASLANHNKITIDANGIAANLEHEYPELSAVTVETPIFGHRPKIVLQAAPPAVRLLGSNGSMYLVDTNGKAVAVISGTQNANLPLVVDQSSLPASVGSAVLSASAVTFVQMLVAQMQAHHIAIASLTLPASAAELDMRVQGKPYYVKFNLETAADQQIGTFLALNNYLVTKNITPKQYINAEVSGRAYYK